jgi:putative transcriptional regulator
MSHPAPEELLLDYATGTLAEGPALAVALHVALDPAARRTVAALAAMGGALIDAEAPAADDEAMLQRALASLEGVPVDARLPPTAPPAGFEWAPPPLRRYLPRNPTWRRVLGRFDEIRIGAMEGAYRVSLLRLQPGEGLPMHRHVANEYTVVLQGGYTDATGNYVVGDFAVGPGPQEHEPVADPGEPCIALIVVERPIVLTGPLGRWLNPLVRRGWL